MFMNNKDEIINWLKENIDNRSEILDDLVDNLKFIQKDNYLIVNSNYSLIFNYLHCTTLPIKFGTINGSFYIPGSNLINFNGFPDVINGNLRVTNSYFKENIMWNIKEVNGYINLCGLNCELDNLDFLENTKFKSFDLKITNSVFKNDVGLFELDDYKDLKINLKYNNDELEYEDLKLILSFSKNLQKTYKEVDDYLSSFDNNLNKEIN